MNRARKGARQALARLFIRPSARLVWSCFPVLCLSACPDLPDGPRYRGAGSSEPRRGGTLMLSEESRVRGLDTLGTDVISGALVEMLFDTLYAYDHDMKLVPRLAQALPTVSADGLTFVVPLREGVRFHHGRKVTARDVVWSIERMLSPRAGSPGAAHYSAIEGFEAYRAGRAKSVSGLSAPDDLHVTIRLSRPDQSFLHRLAMRFVTPVPREVVEARGTAFSERPVGTGPFRFVSWDPGVRIVLERNRHYFRAGLPYVDRVVFEEAISRETAFLRFRNGELDVITRVSPADRALLLGSPQFRPYAQVSPTPDVWGIVMNCEVPPFDNVHVRRAVAFAIDRERWSIVRNRGIRPTGQMVPPKLMAHADDLPHAQRFDLAKARDELRLAGHPDGLSEPITLWLSDSPTGRAYGALAQADLARIGIRVQLKSVSFPVYLASTAKRRAVQAFAGGWVMDYPDPANFLGLLHSNAIDDEHSVNKAFYANPALDRLLDAGLVERSRERRAAIYREANDLVAREAPWAFFANSQTPQAFQPYVRGYRAHPVYWLPVQEVWLDLPRKRVVRSAGHAAPSWLARLSPLEVPR